MMLPILAPALGNAHVPAVDVFDALLELVRRIVRAVKKQRHRASRPHLFEQRVHLHLVDDDTQEAVENFWLYHRRPSLTPPPMPSLVDLLLSIRMTPRLDGVPDAQKCESWTWTQARKAAQGERMKVARRSRRHRP